MARLGLGFVFVNVMLEQLGVPVPAVPTLVLAGAMTGEGRLSFPVLMVAGIGACLLGDSAWYFAGQRYGGRVMSLLCRVSLTPDACVSQAQHTFSRWGSSALVFAKFIPGLSMVAPPLAGAMRMRLPRFLALSTLSAALWVGAALTAGLLLRPQIEKLLPQAASLGGSAVLVVLLLLGAYVAWKWLERRRLRVILAVERIGVDELARQLQSDDAPLVVDVRTALARSLDARVIPGAVHVPAQEIQAHASRLPREREVVLYCSCPNEVSAAHAARWLLEHGYRRARPLQGGLDAWAGAGHPLETATAAAPADLRHRNPVYRAPATVKRSRNEQFP
ncbi:MAG: DedA family protein/thiosulfate sulfurtransferase GlpE [Proteobacteria bacterium]|nr:DedA family protein/thiosulfate sulfurtransferase GlpE [Pseudomonadota bacterium]